MSAPLNLGNLTTDEVSSALDSYRVPMDIAVYSIDNYFNFGGIVRLCHNFMVRNIYAIDINKYYRRADMGSRKYESIIKLSLDDFLNEGLTVVAFEARIGLMSKDIRDYQYPPNPCLLFGSERTGVPDEILEMATDIVSIPVFGVHNDHNVNIAAGMIMYDFMCKHPQHYDKRAFGTLPGV